MFSTRKLVLLSFLVTLAAALGFLEMHLPNPFPFPGAKLGLANIVTLLVLYLFSVREGILVSILRVCFISFLSGTFLAVGFWLSLSGALLSTLAMAVVIKYWASLSIVGVSIIGALFHNLGQIFVAAFLMHTQHIFYYLPFLLLVSLPTGLLTGYLARLLRPFLR